MLAAGGLRKGTRYVVRVVKDGESLARQTGLLDGRGRPVRGLPPQIVAGSVVRRRGGLARRVPRPRVADRAGPLVVARDHLPRARRPRSRWSVRPGGWASRAKAARGARASTGSSSATATRSRALLTRLGAHDVVLAWEERRMRREVRATANRLANFDDANLRRSARAAVAAGARVERALEILGDEVPDHLREAGRLRIAHGQASLEELGQLADPPMTKDAVAGRIRRLLAMADKRAADLGIPDTEAALTADMLDAEHCRRGTCTAVDRPWTLVRVVRLESPIGSTRRRRRRSVRSASGTHGERAARHGDPWHRRIECEERNRDRPRRHQRLRPDRPQLLPRGAGARVPTSRSSPSTT